MEKKVILITGASSGMGYEAAKELAGQGNKVYGAARRVEKMASLKEYGVTPLHLDVTDESSCKETVEEIVQREGRLDVLINNAGYGSYGAIEDVDLTEAKRQFDVNLFGMAALTKAALPYMRAQHSGTIINISSMGGRIVSFMGGWYHATKYAVEAFSDALRMETKQFGINVVLIEPGGIKTNWGHIAADHLAESAKGGAYEETANRVSAGMHKQYSGNMMSDPKVVTRAISRAVNARRPRPRYLIGFGAKPLVFAHTVLPTRMFDFIMTHAS
ncbi:oxidoreductase [Lactobacillus nasalidis]|nr:oxidoreductase [Lactobacillus nasalidis]GHV97557.1 short-chain dehydrogenase/reductase [Lactobacillus nasalidis]GHW00293.1 short-chain dehydrogenase/reductase [Lactobacillus nasalidis]